MTWLSEIEFRIKITEGSDTATIGQAYVALDHYEIDGNRMARVIRELVKQIKEVRNIANDTPEEADPRVLDDALTNIVIALRDEWSPDAKELVEAYFVVKESDK